MLDLYSDLDTHKEPISDKELTDAQVIEEIKSIKNELKDKVVVLGHHYQSDEIIQFADVKGDSLALAKEAAKQDKPYIIFCGVHFMAETADMLTSSSQKVILPDLKAGCSMADMANRTEIDKCWSKLTSWTDSTIIPITYINCDAQLKSFVGENNGSICTSSNAEKIITWALEKGEKLLFFPDQHLGRNTCYKLGIDLDEMVLYDPRLQNGGLTQEQVIKAKVILWYGYCSVHQGFKKQQIDHLNSSDPERTIIVHPECSFDVVQASHDNGSTAYIIDKIKNAKPGSKFAVGTEINLVNRLAKEHPDKDITSLSPYQCLCTTMYRVRPRWLLESFRSIKKNEPINVITVSEDVTRNSLKALDQMLEIS